MTNKEIAKKIKNIIPFWECEGDIYKQTLEILKKNDKKLISDIIEFLTGYYNSEPIIEELKKKIKN